MKNLQRILIILLLLVLTLDLSAQSKKPPLPVEVFGGHQEHYAQTVIKRSFGSSSFSFFSLATYTASYDNNPEAKSMVMINQLNYNLKNGFGLMAGADMNSVVGFSPIVGPQHSFASKKFLAVTVVSFFINQGSDMKLFGLYEYTPALYEGWSLYNRIQFIYNQSLKGHAHNRSYLYLRSGIQWNSLVFGLAANLNQYGPDRAYGDSYGLFVRWEFH